MLQKGDLKFRLHGRKLNGDFALVHMKARRPGSKGTEWLLIKKHDDAGVAGFDIEEYDKSVLTGRNMAQIAGDEGSAEWESNRPAARSRRKSSWLDETLARVEKKQRKSATTQKKSTVKKNERVSAAKAVASKAAPKKTSSAVAFVVSSLKGVVERSIPAAIHPMLATPISKAFDDPAWLFEIKWDGYRAVAFVENGKVRLVSRNQNDLSGQFSELQELPTSLRAHTAVLDGEVVALDEEGRPSFSLMQQRTGLRGGGRRTAARGDLPILYYVFDLLYVDGYDLRRVSLEERKKVLESLVVPGNLIRYSDHYPAEGTALFEVAKQKGLEGIVAKRRNSCYEERRSREWLKIKITHTLDCVIGGYTDPEGSRQYFGSLVLGLYNKNGELIHVGNAGSGFNHASLKQMWEQLKARETKRNPFYGPVDAKRTHWVTPELVAEIKYTEWTHETAEGGLKLRAPVFIGLRQDKEPRECNFEDQMNA